jgi:hypothetical protein
VINVLNVVVPCHKEWDLKKLYKNSNKSTKIIKIEEMEIMMVNKETVVKYALKKQQII